MRNRTILLCMTYSLDFRQKVLKIKAEEKLSLIEVANRFDIGVPTVMRWSKKVEPKPIRQRPAIKIDMEALKKDVELYPDAYLKERASRFNVSHMSIWFALKRLNVTCKKNSAASKSGPRKAFYVLPED